MSSFSSLVDYANQVDSEVVSYDTETNHKQEIKADLWGFSVVFTEAKAFYIPWRYPDGQYFWSPSDRQTIVSWLKKITEEKYVIGHNVLYDVLVTENNFKFDFTNNIIADTILMHHAIHEEPPHGLKEVAVKFLGEWADKAQDKLKQEVLAAGGSWNNDQKDMYLASTETLLSTCVPLS